jgi:cytochrome P450
MMRRIVDEHIRTGGAEEERDLVDAYLGKMAATTDPSTSFYGRAGRTNLEQNMLELFGAGANPVASTLSFCFLYLARQPHLQEKIFAEIEAAVGSGNSGLPLAMEDAARLPYTNAFIHEILRITAINFIGTPHMNVQASKIGDYEVPAGTTVFSFLWYILNDPAYWVDPRTFRPERFLDAQGEFAKDERLIPFLVGRRQCIGMSLAQTELFLFFANLVRQFRFEESPSAPLPEPKATMGFVMGCPAYEVLITSR